MANDSFTALFVELTLAGQSLKASNYFQSLEIDLVTSGSWTATLGLWDTDTDYLDSLIFNAGGGSPVDITFGYVDDSSTHTLLQGDIIKATPEFTPEGTGLTLDLVARSVVRTVLNKRDYSFPEGSTVSTIVRQIAETEGWTTSDESGAGTIEETSPPLTEPLMATGESAMKFIKEQLLPLATNASGSGGFCAFFDRRGSFHFHSPNFLNPKSTRFIFARGNQGQVISFAPADTEIFAALIGGSSGSHASVDSRSGTTTETETTQENAEAGTPAGSSYNQELPEEPEAVAYRSAVISRSQEESEARATALHDSARRMPYTAELEVHGTNKVEALDYVNIDYFKTNGQRHYLSGQFQVIKISHDFGDSGWHTKFELSRTGVGAEEGAVARGGSGGWFSTGNEGEGSTVGVPVQE
jgi:phage protein D